MSTQLRHVLSYEQMVAEMLKVHPEDDAMAFAVGGNYERFGVLEHAILKACGLTPDASVIDVGCGSGRLATQLARYPALRYLGTDLVPALLDYARRRAARPDFRFEPVNRPVLPAEDASADFVTFFSVFTHILHEESYVYLAEARRVLRPGGRAVFSFLEFAVEHNWTVFDANVEWVRARSMAGHLNVFQHRADIRAWARRLEFEVAAFHAGDERWIEVDGEAATEAVPAGPYALGQSVCVLQVPAAGTTAAGARRAARAAKTQGEDRADAARRRVGTGATPPAGGPKRRRLKVTAGLPDADAAKAARKAQRQAAAAAVPPTVARDDRKAERTARRRGKREG